MILKCYVVCVNGFIASTIEMLLMTEIGLMA